MLTRVFGGPVEWELVAFAIMATLVLAWVGGRIARRMAETAIRALVRDTLAPSSSLVRKPLRLVQMAVFLLLFGVLLFPAFEVVGLRPRTGVHLSTLAAWTFESGLRVGLIVAMAYVLVRVTKLLVSRFEHELNLGTGLDALERAKRARTLGAAINKVVTAAVAVIATRTMTTAPVRVRRPR